MDKTIIISVQTWELPVINNPPTFQLDIVTKKIKISNRIFCILEMVQILIQG